MAKWKGTKLGPVSILKPLKGADEGLRENLESFFRLEYPEYELIFSVADAGDPACEVVRELIENEPLFPNRKIQASLIVGDVEAGPNPKVNNLIRSYAAARNDLILISDSNIRVDSTYLRRCVDLMTPGVGVVTAAVTGQDELGFGGKLEAMYLNTFYARWMVAANAFGFPAVMGKSMLFSKSTAARFGGIRNLSQYLAEDYATGQAMRHLGLKCKVMSDPVPQVIGHVTLKAFWQRHLRWGRMRKNMQLFGWMGELVAGPIGSGLLGAYGFQLIFGEFPVAELALHFLLWFYCDFLLMIRLSTPVTRSMPLIWLAREIVSVPLWFHTLCGNTVLWRGKSLRLEAGGVLALDAKGVESGSLA